MKVLYLIDSLGGGGTERSTIEMVQALRDKNVIPLVVCLHQRVGVEDEAVRSGLEVKYLQQRRFFSRINEVRDLIRTFRPDVIHTALYSATMVGRFAGWRMSVPVVTSLVNTQYGKARLGSSGIHPLKVRAVQAFDAVTGRCLTSHFHAVSESAKLAAIRDLRVPPSRITVIERGRSAERLGKPCWARRQRARSNLGLPDDALVLVNIGRQDHQKGQKYLIQAVAELCPDHPRLRLLIAGAAGDVSADLACLVKKMKLDRCVSFLGFRKDVPEILSAADVFVFPSLYEGLPGAVIEALALGLPVVASDIGPLRELVEDGRNGQLVPVAHVKSLVTAINSLLADEQVRARYGVRSREIYLARFTLERSAERMLNLYTSVSTGLSPPAKGVQV